MATHAQRAQAIADAILNKSALPSQVNRLGQAMAFQGGFLNEYDAMAPAEKAAFLVGRVRGHCVAIVKQFDQALAIEIAKNQVALAVDAEFAEQ